MFPLSTICLPSSDKPQANKCDATYGNIVLLFIIFCFVSVCIWSGLCSIFLLAVRSEHIHERDGLVDFVIQIRFCVFVCSVSLQCFSLTLAYVNICFCGQLLYTFPFGVFSSQFWVRFLRLVLYPVFQHNNYLSAREKNESILFITANLRP